MITANEAKIQVLSTSRALDAFDAFVRREVAEKRFAGNFSYDPDLTEEELDYIREVLGFHIVWNRACLWYEVSWG